MENSNFSKVLRQLPEGVVRWLLQDCMFCGIPEQFTDLHSGQCEMDVKQNILEISDSYLFFGGVRIYDLLLDKQLLKPVKYQDPTEEQVKAIYEGVEEVQCVMYSDDKAELHLKTLFQNKKMEWFTYFTNHQEVTEGELCIFQKGKGFALPISWKEEGKDLISPEAFLTLKGHDVDAIVHPHDRSLTIGKMNLFELMKEYFNYLTNSNDTNVATLEETPEQKGKRIEEDNTTQIFNRLQALEDFTGINAPKEVENVDGEFTHFVSLVYKSRNCRKLRSLITNAKDERDALENAVEEFKYEVEGMSLEMKTILTLPNKGEIV